MSVTRYVESAGMLLVIEPDDYVCEFVVYECIGTDDSGPVLGHHNGRFLEPCESIEQAKRYMHGDVKWDGCINWDLDPSDCMQHNCGLADAVAIADIFRAIYDEASRLCENWNEACAR